MAPKFIQEQRKKEELRAALRERGIDPDILEAAPDVIAAIGLKFLEDKKPDPVAVKQTDGARPAGWA